MSADLASRRFHRNRVRKLITSDWRHVALLQQLRSEHLGPVRDLEFALTFFHKLGYCRAAGFALRLSVFHAFDGPIGTVGGPGNNAFDNNFDKTLTAPSVLINP